MEVLISGDLTVTGEPDAAPLAGSVTMDVTLTAALLSVQAQLSGSVTMDATITGALAADPPPDNDPWAGAIVMASDTGATAFSNEFATAEVDDPIFLDGNHTVWFKWTPSVSGEATITTGPDRLTATDTTPWIDTLLGVYTGASLAGLTPVGQNDDKPDIFGAISEVTFTAIAGTTYYVGIDAGSDIAFSAAAANAGKYGYGPGTLSWDVFTSPAIELTLADGDDLVTIPTTIAISLANVPPGPTDVGIYWDDALLTTVTVDESGTLINESITLPETATVGGHTLKATVISNTSLTASVTVTVLAEVEDDVPVDPIFPEPVPQNGVIKWVLQDPTTYINNEKQTITLTRLDPLGTSTPGPTSTFRLTFDGSTSADIPANATAGQVQAALVALQSLGGDDVIVTGGPAHMRPFTVEFVGTKARTNVVQMTGTLHGIAFYSSITIATTVVGGTETVADPYEYIFPINPNAMTSPFGPKNITSRAAVGPNGQKIAWEGTQPPVEWQWSGDLFSKEMYENLELWTAKGNRVFLTDHFQRRWIIYLTHFDPVPKRSVKYPWRHTYTMKAIVFSGPEYVA